MGTLITIYKIIAFIFPFVKEVFIKKERPATLERRRSDRRNPRPQNNFLKTIIIIMGCLSVAFNFYIVGKAYNLGRENIQLKKQIKEKTPVPMLYPKDNKPNNVPLPEFTPPPVMPPMPPQSPPRYPRPEHKPTAAPPKEDDKLIEQLQDINKIN